MLKIPFTHFLIQTGKLIKSDFGKHFHKHIIQAYNAIIHHSAKGVVSDIYAGIERASWYSSCFIPQYTDICKELKSEEIRSLYSIESIYRHRDVIAYMLYLYFKMVCDDVEKDNSEGSARKLIKTMTGLASHMNIAGGTRYVLLRQFLLRFLSLASCLRLLLNVYQLNSLKRFLRFNSMEFNKNVLLLPDTLKLWIPNIIGFCIRKSLKCFIILSIRCFLKLLKK